MIEEMETEVKEIEPVNREHKNAIRKFKFKYIKSTKEVLDYSLNDINEAIQNRENVIDIEETDPFKIQRCQQVESGISIELQRILYEDLELVKPVLDWAQKLQVIKDFQPDADNTHT